MEERRLVALASSPFDPTLPHLAEKIFSYLPGKDLKHCRLVCKNWNDSASSLLWTKTDIRLTLNKKTRFLKLIKCGSSQRIRFGFHFNPVDLVWDLRMPIFLLKDTVIDTVGSVTWDHCEDMELLQRLLTEVPKLKRMKVSIERTKLPQLGMQRRKYDGIVSNIRILELKIVINALKSSEEVQERCLAAILQLCVNLKELQVEDESKTKRVSLDNIYKALPYPGLLGSLQLISSKAITDLDASTFDLLAKFSNLKDLNLLEWGQFPIHLCSKAITKGTLPPALESFKLSVSLELEDRLLHCVSLLPKLRLEGTETGRKLNKVAIRLPGILYGTFEEWDRIDGKLELTTAKLVAIDSQRIPNLTCFQQLHTLTLSIFPEDYTRVLHGIPRSLKHLFIKFFGQPGLFQTLIREGEEKAPAALHDLKTISIDFDGHYYGPRGIN